jgi:hypothetical protein
MKQEDKDLLVKDICGRLPYGVKVSYKCNQVHEIGGYHPASGLTVIKDTKTNSLVTTNIENIVPYLFPLSSMTGEQSKIYHELIGGMFGTSALINFEVLEDFFHKNHLDYRGLITMGLANDASGKNIY